MISSFTEKELADKEGNIPERKKTKLLAMVQDTFKELKRDNSRVSHDYAKVMGSHLGNVLTSLLPELIGRVSVPNDTAKGMAMMSPRISPLVEKSCVGINGSSAGKRHCPGKYRGHCRKCSNGTGKEPEERCSDDHRKSSMDKFHGSQDQPFFQRELHPPHCRCCLMRPEVLRQIFCPDRTILDKEFRTAASHPATRSPAPQLGDDDLPVPDNAGKTGTSNPPYQFFCPECPFSGSTPDIDPFGIQHKDPCIDTSEGRPQGIETECVICRGKDRGVRIRVPETVEAGLHPVALPLPAPAGKEVVEPVGKCDSTVCCTDL